jgi:AraC-like DNA-binding protein
MDEVIENAVERVIRSMRENLGEPITINDMARTAMFSKFHFSRIFQRVTGVSPGRFLSALRLQEAKRLLRSTNMTVADISHVVGYNSIGTFSTRFRASVGLSPTEYRQFDSYPAPLPTPPAALSGTTTVRGHIWSPPNWRPGLVAAGLFPDRIAQGCPVRRTARLGPGAFVIDHVPVGSWYLLAHSAGPADDLSRGNGGGPNRDTDYGDELWDEFDTDFAGADPEPLVSSFGPIEIRHDEPVRPIDLWLRPISVFDPPVLLAQLDQPVHTWAPGRAEQIARPGA